MDGEKSGITWCGAFFNAFVPCFLLGLACFALLFSFIELGPTRERLGLPLFSLLQFALVNALLCAATAALGYGIFGRRIFSSTTGLRLKIIGVALAAGALTPFILLPAGALAVGCIVVFLASRHTIDFFSGLRTMLLPQYHLTWPALGKLSLIYANLMAAFSIINLNLTILSELSPNMEKAFAFSSGPEVIVDVVYFSIVLMTTVGFGDIHPLSPLAKAFVAAECLISYLMFALLVGLIMRGVVSSDK